MSVVRAVLLAAVVVGSVHAVTSDVPGQRDRPCRVSWYDADGQRGCAGRCTLEGDYAASKSLPFGSRVRVSFRGRSVVVTIRDRGPFVRGRDLDISPGAVDALAARSLGVFDARCVTLPTSPTARSASVATGAGACSASRSVSATTRRIRPPISVRSVLLESLSSSSVCPTTRSIDAQGPSR